MEIKKTFSVLAIWDEEAEVFYSESDIEGLHIEASTIEEFDALVSEFAPDLIVENHISKEALVRTSLRDLIPTIRLQTPAKKAIAC